MVSWIRIEHGISYNVPGLKQYGTLCVLKRAEGNFERRDPDSGWSDYPQVEQGYYYSEDSVRTSHVLAGNRTLNLFANHAGLSQAGSRFGAATNA